jgi:hypothetical protein
MCPDTLAKNIVNWSLRDLERVFNGAIRTVDKGGIFGAKATGIADGTDLEPTERYTECERVIRKIRREDKRGQVHEIEGTVYGWKVLLLIVAATKIPLAIEVGQTDEHEALWTRALVPKARLNVQGYVRLHVMFTLLMFAPAKAYRLQCEREALEKESVGWRCSRRQLWEQTRNQVIVFAHGSYGIFHLAEYSLLLGVRLNDIPPEIGSRQQVLAKLALPVEG